MNIDVHHEAVQEAVQDAVHGAVHQVRLCKWLHVLAQQQPSPAPHTHAPDAWQIKQLAAVTAGTDWNRSLCRARRSMLL